MEFPTTLETERLSIRTIGIVDVEALFEIFSNADVMRYWAWPALKKREEAEALVRRIMDGYENGDGIQMGLIRKLDGRFLGTCSLFNFAPTCRRAEVGYALGREHWGQGYMAEALRCWVSHCFGPMNLNRLEADIDPRNLASARSLERLGFQKEGLLRQRWIVDGEVSDSEIYGLLAEDWNSRH